MPVIYSRCIVWIVWMYNICIHIIHDIPKEQTSIFEQNILWQKKTFQNLFPAWPCKVDRFTRVESQGVWGIIEGEVVGAGSKRFLDSMAIDLPKEAEEQVRSRGCEVLNGSKTFEGSLVKASVLMKSMMHWQPCTWNIMESGYRLGWNWGQMMCNLVVWHIFSQAAYHVVSLFWKLCSFEGLCTFSISACIHCRDSWRGEKMGTKRWCFHHCLHDHRGQVLDSRITVVGFSFQL